METVDLSKAAGFQAVDSEGNVLGTVSMEQLTDSIAMRIADGLSERAVLPANNVPMAVAATSTGSDKMETAFSETTDPAYVRVIDKNGNSAKQGIASLASVVGGLLPVASSSNKGLMDEMIYQNTVMSQTDNKITDMDAISTGYYGIHKNIMINNSSGIDYGALFCIAPPVGGNAVGADVCVQIAFDYYNNAVKTRVRWLKSWSTWKELSFK